MPPNVVSKSAQNTPTTKLQKTSAEVVGNSVGLELETGLPNEISPFVPT